MLPPSSGHGVAPEKTNIDDFSAVRASNLKLFSICNEHHDHGVRFQVHTAASAKMTAFWDISMCSLVKVDRRFSAVYCLYHQGDK
jgi:hypothetical protein